ncbi:Glyoxalase/Bleomycin resistance protein/Dioxygenase superfamily protein [Jeotgalicoccus saudimassiliensis]|uniref:Glyoxalase/Bleomycin resistance protein/Dioxygenase superfamily protein n=1 Tax=Jeotgalicoccus saudimassiliensis TaxID=1461582 RepID=A0A078M7J4_9STAP|nr:VOC family protein [Jeotgalicoccus saudimassiliensis]CEA01342.1 Glyoxalase/Bleomycin resistance protein/Dioxygenase superfamily protein [Jeotgalicoccus saudimassiliensis]
MNIIVTSLFVDDQEKALNFYTHILGFVKKHDVPAGNFRWITVVSKDDQNGTELVLEPNDNIAAQDYQNSLMQQGIPATMFGTDDIDKEYERLKAHGVEFTMEPKAAGDMKLAVFNDTCGNLIQLIEQ